MSHPDAKAPCFPRPKAFFQTKVTPSSKVVGDLAMFCITRGIKPADILNLEAGATPFPESVIDMLMGGLGQPMGGWPKKLQKVVLGDKKPLNKRPGAGLKPLDLEKVRREIETKIGRKVSDDDLYDYLMYPEVFTEFARFARDYSDIEGKRVVNYELNGMARSATIQDKSVKAEKPPRVQADPSDPMQVAAPIPGMVTSLAVSVGGKVAKGDKLVTLEAMKMYTTINAPVAGVVEAIHAQVGDAVESKDLLVKLRA